MGNKPFEMYTGVTGINGYGQRLKEIKYLYIITPLNPLEMPIHMFRFFTKSHLRKKESEVKFTRAIRFKVEPDFKFGKLGYDTTYGTSDPRLIKEFECEAIIFLNGHWEVYNELLTVPGGIWSEYLENKYRIRELNDQYVTGSEFERYWHNKYGIYQSEDK